MPGFPHFVPMNVYDLHNPWIRFVVPTLGTGAAAAAAIWLLKAGNPLAAFCILATLVMVQIAIIAPRVGLILLLCVCAYSDLTKRLLVIFGTLSMDQVSNVLMAAPAVVMGLLFSIVTRRIFHMLRYRPMEIFLAMVAVILAAASFITALRRGGTLIEAAKDAVNHGVYTVAAVVGMRLFENATQVEKFLRTALLIFIPVALYGLVQLTFGMADFEVEYLRSGLTIEAKQLYEIRPRPFSTLNSAGVYGTLCAGFALLALYPRFARRHRPLQPGETASSIIMSLIFFAGAFGSLVRSSHIVWIIALIAFACFRSGKGTLLFYSTAVGGFIALILSAGFLLEHLPDIDPAHMVQSDYGVSVLTISTYSDRLKGFINLMSSKEMYSLFGLRDITEMTDLTFNHDPISTILIEHGVVGLAVLLIGATVMVVWFHRKLLAMPKGRDRTLAVLLAALLAGWTAAEVLVKAVITTFPLNALYWLFLGALARLISRKKEPSEAPKEAPLLPLRASQLAGVRPFRPVRRA